MPLPRASRWTLWLAVLAVVVAGSGTAGHAAAGASVAAMQTSRLVVIGDIHGAHEELVRLLEAVELIDGGGSWIAGRDVLVQTGDFMDRGPGVRDVMELLIRLQGEARASGGRVEVLLGNHEVMNLAGVFRDLTPELLAAFADPESPSRQRSAYREYERTVLRRDPAWRSASRTERRAIERDWLEAHPPGLVEFIDAIGPDGGYGRWLRGLSVVHRERDLVFLHAGIGPGLADWSPERVDRRVRAELALLDGIRTALDKEGKLLPTAGLAETVAAAAELVGGVDELEELAESVPGWPPELPEPNGVAPIAPEALAPLGRLDDWFLFDPEGPIWFRGYARWDYFELRERMPAILEGLGARAVFVGHTPQASGIRVRGEGMVYLVDTGMLESVYEGSGEALVLSGETALAVRSDGGVRKLPAPAGVE